MSEVVLNPSSQYTIPVTFFLAAPENRTQRHEDTKEDWSIWEYKLADVESILFSASLPIELRAFVPLCESLLIGGTKGIKRIAN